MLGVHRQFIVLRYTASHTTSGKRRRAETLYGVARKSADLLRMSLVTSAAMLAICLLTLVETTNTAEADDSLPQNGKIAFTSVRNGDVEATIYAVEPDGSNRSQLTNGGYPNWSPDGTEIVFAEPDRANISVVSADGPNVGTSHTIEGAFGSDPTWLPDGTKVAVGNPVLAKISTL